MDGSIAANHVFHNLDTDTTYRVLWLSPTDGYLYWIPMRQEVHVPQKIRIADVERLVENLTLVSKDAGVFTAEHDPTPTEKARRDRIWAAMKDALLDEPAIYERTSRAAHLRRIEAETGIKMPHLYRYLGEYWKGGKSPDAFIPKYRDRGGKGKQRQAGQSKLGRPSSPGTLFGKKLNDTDFANFKDAVTRYYMNEKRLSFKDAYDRMLKDHYSVPDPSDTEGKGLLVPLPAGEVPSIRQFRYWYERRGRDLQMEVVKRHGQTAFDQKHRSILSRSDLGMLGPGSQFQIDATVGDIYLVSQLDRTRIIGRPVLYFIMDTYTRMVTGMYVGLEGPSWVAAMMAIANMAADKVAYCADFGVEIEASEWPCHHVPALLLGDRGEMESRNSSRLTDAFGIRIDTAPPFRADLKGYDKLSVMVRKEIQPVDCALRRWIS